MNISKTISPFSLTPPDAAPEKSQPALARLQASVGAVPNLAAAMAASPTLIDGFVTLRTLFHEHSTLQKADRELLFLTNAVENGCGYCTAIHTAFGLQVGLSPATVEAVRAQHLPDDAREAALVRFDRLLLRGRGRVEPEDIRAFIAAGFTPEQALELIAAAALSTLANFSGRLTGVALDEFLQPHAVTHAC
jgi:uncharacterized peroxidase-related enzyme